MTDVGTEETVAEIDRLRVDHVLVVRPHARDNRREVAELAEELARKARVPVVILEGGAEIESLSEEEMLAAGWVRRDAGDREGGSDHA